MAGFDRRIPAKRLGELVTPSAVATVKGCHLPGPLGIAEHHLDIASSTDRDGLGLDPALNQFRSVTFSVGSATYQLRRYGAAWSPGFRAEPVDLDDARRIVEDVIRQRVDDVGLVNLLKIALPRLSQREHPDRLMLVRLWPDRSTPPTQGPSGDAPPPRRQRPPGPRPSPSVEESTVPAEEATAQADTLRRAAESGVPFCEICAREAAERLAAAGA